MFVSRVILWSYQGPCFHHLIGSALQPHRVNKNWRPNTFKSMGEAMRFARRSKNFNAPQLAVMLGKEEKGKAKGTYIFDIEQGRVTPTPLEREKLERVMGCTFTRPKQRQTLRKI
eukprot:GDKI01010776.1.p2 GENE.GDKI01010776.1~~GDKI01010776.1.p2  ORF type:complete len:115 (-),score=4.82 GDKI01010776.1:400-744(-)